MQVSTQLLSLLAGATVGAAAHAAAAYVVGVVRGGLGGNVSGGKVIYGVNGAVLGTLAHVGRGLCGGHGRRGCRLRGLCLRVWRSACVLEVVLVVHWCLPWVGS